MADLNENYTGSTKLKDWWRIVKSNLHILNDKKAEKTELSSAVSELNAAIQGKADKQNENGGFSAGVNSRAGSGAGIGAWSVAYSGAALGKYAKAEYGGAAGHGAVTSDGFAGGHDAKAADSNGNGIDAVQLGTGTNSTPKTLQVYDYPLMDAEGSIPEERLVNAPKTNVVDNLTSSSATDALSAKQGKALKDLVDTKANQCNTQTGGFEGGGGAGVTNGGAALGMGAYANNGGAIGNNASAGDGFSGGYLAEAGTINGVTIDTIQLGSGHNDTPKTMQVYSKRIVEADGSLTDVGKLSELNTTAKGTVVAAINELKANGGGTGAAGGITDLGTVDINLYEDKENAFANIRTAGIYKYNWDHPLCGLCSGILIVSYASETYQTLQLLIDNVSGILVRDVSMTTNWSRLLNDSNVVNSLSSTSIKNPLSANQGKTLNDKINKKADRAETSLFCGSSSGSAGQLLVSNSNVTSFTNGTRIRFVPHINCAEGCKLKLNSFAAYPIHNSKGAVKEGELKAGIPVELNYYGGKYFFNQPGFGSGDVLGPGEATILSMQLRETKDITVETSNGAEYVCCDRIGDHYYVCFGAPNSNSNDMIAKYDLNWNNIWVADMGDYISFGRSTVPYVDENENVYIVAGRYGYKILSDGSTVSKLYYGLSPRFAGRYVYVSDNGTLSKYDITEMSKNSPIWSKSTSSITGILDDGEHLIVYYYTNGTMTIHKLAHSSGETVSTSTITGLSTAASGYYIAGSTGSGEYYMHSYSLNSKSGDKLYVLNPDFSIKCSEDAYVPRPYNNMYLSGRMPIDNFGNIYIYPSIVDMIKPTFILKFDTNLSREIINLNASIAGIGLDKETNALICSTPRGSNTKPTFHIFDVPKVIIK